MKVTDAQIRRIIREEIERLKKEQAKKSSKKEIASDNK